MSMWRPRAIQRPWSPKIASENIGESKARGAKGLFFNKVRTCTTPANADSAQMHARMACAHTGACIAQRRKARTRQAVTHMEARTKPERQGRATNCRSSSAKKSLRPDREANPFVDDSLDENWKCDASAGDANRKMLRHKSKVACESGPVGTSLCQRIARRRTHGNLVRRPPAPLRRPARRSAAASRNRATALGDSPGERTHSRRAHIAGCALAGSDWPSPS